MQPEVQSAHQTCKTSKISLRFIPITILTSSRTTREKLRNGTLSRSKRIVQAKRKRGKRET